LSATTLDPVPASFSRALALHRAGQLDQAELLYRRILDDDPGQPDALHLLGVVAHQRGRHDQAVALIGRALAVRPDHAAYHAHLAEAWRARGDLAAARQHAETAVRLQPASAAFHNVLGLALQAQGLHIEAADHFQEAIRLDPAFAMAHNNLALSLRELGRPADAVAAFREAVRLGPDLPEARSNLGQMLLERHQPREALAHCREALRLRPGYPEALNNLGNVLRELGRLEQAKACYQQVLRARPRQAMAHNNLGQALQEEGRLGEALACYRQALALEPRSARFLCNLATAMHELDRDADALALCRRALQADARYADAHALLGALLQEAGDGAGARAAYGEALRLKPDGADARLGLGQALAEEGDLDAALACYREALRHEPHSPAAHAVLATSLGRKLPAEDLEAALRLLGAPMSERQRSALRYGLAHALDGRLRYAEAAEQLRLANAARLQLLVHQGKGYDGAAHDRFVGQLLDVFDADHFARVHGWGLDCEEPVFVVGLPRSGTTLTEQVLASHSQVHGAGELRFARDAFEEMPALLGIQAAPADCVGRYRPEAVRAAARRHLEKLRQLAPSARRVVDKMPDNYLHLGLLATLFPRARFIHTRRDVRDTALSCWLTNFKQINWACDLGHIAGRVLAYERLMEHWRRVLPVPLLEVDYEETVADPEGVARRLVAWCGLEWEPACLEFHKTRRTVRTASVTQVRQPIYKHSVGRWKNYEAALAPFLEKLTSQVAPQDACVRPLR
jgi:tetratricopeptide (TPR) repeat protein